MGFGECLQFWVGQVVCGLGEQFYGFFVSCYLVIGVGWVEGGVVQVEQGCFGFVGQVGVVFDFQFFMFGQVVQFGVDFVVVVDYLFGEYFYIGGGVFFQCYFVGFDFCYVGC